MSTTLKLIAFLFMIGGMLVVYTTSEKWQRLMPKRWPVYLAVMFIVYRIGAFVLLFPILHVSLSGDAVGFWDYAQRIHAGARPLDDLVSDYGTPYNPLFYYILALARTEYQMLFIFLVIEVFTFFCFFKLMWNIGIVPQVQLWAVLYISSPVPVYYTVYAAQEDVWILLIYTLPMLLFMTHRASILHPASGVIMGVGLFATKLTALLPLPFVVGLSRDIRRVLLSYLAAGVVGLLFVLSLGPQADRVLDILEHASGAAGPNIWRVLNGVTQGLIPTSSSLYSLLLFGVIWSAGVALNLHYSMQDGAQQPVAETQARRFILGWVVIWSLYFVLTAHIWAAYTMYWMAPLLALLVMAEPRKRWLLAAVLFVNVYPAFGDFLFVQFGSATYNSLDGLGDVVWFFFDCLLLLTYAYIGWTAAQLLRSPTVQVDPSVQPMDASLVEGKKLSGFGS
jgi:hypothetical protein